MEYTVYVLNLVSNDISKVVSFNAQRIDSISWSSNENDVLMSGADVDGSTGAGFYKFNIDEKVVKQIVSEDTLKSTKQIESFSSPYSLCESVDRKKLYFSAVPVGVQKMNVDGMVYYPSCLYCYDLGSNTLKKVFTKPNSFITALSTTY